MNSKTPNLLKPTLLAIVVGVVSNLIYWILTISISKLELNLSTAIIIFLITCLVVTVIQLSKYYRFMQECDRLLQKLGVIKIYEKAEETIRKGLQEANHSYWWFGTSAYYVVCTPENIHNHIEPKRKTDFLFITIDPECSAALSEQAEWEHLPPEEIAERITKTQKSIEELKEKKIMIKWEGHSFFPTFRIVIINKKKVLVSFYEKKKLGPDCEQLEIEADGLLGEWFIQFFDKSRLLANHMRMERIIGRLLFTKANISKTQLLEEVSKLYKEEDYKCLKRIVDDLCSEQHG